MPQGQNKSSSNKTGQDPLGAWPVWKDLAATYSRGSYTTTTIGKAVFDGRVRDGNGSDHSFMTTKIIGA